MTTASSTRAIAVFGGGCFWCTEAVFQALKGVRSVVSGYAGGPAMPAGQTPTYEQISTGKTGHAEVIQIEFDPTVISYEDLLTVFFATHDPTTPNRQGADIGTQYRSIILYTSDEQREQAQRYIEKLNTDDPQTKPIITEVQPLEIFYPAEDYHQDYYQNNSQKPYCQIVISPKLEKLKEKFETILKEHEQ